MNDLDRNADSRSDQGYSSDPGAQAGNYTSLARVPLRARSVEEVLMPSGEDLVAPEELAAILDRAEKSRATVASLPSLQNYVAPGPGTITTANIYEAGPDQLSQTILYLDERRNNMEFALGFMKKPKADPEELDGLKKQIGACISLTKLAATNIAEGAAQEEMQEDSEAFGRGKERILNHTKALINNNGLRVVMDNLDLIEQKLRELCENKKREINDPSNDLWKALEEIKASWGEAPELQLGPDTKTWGELKEELAAFLNEENFPQSAEHLTEEARQLIQLFELHFSGMQAGIAANVIKDNKDNLLAKAGQFAKEVTSLYACNEQIPEIITHLVHYLETEIVRVEETIISNKLRRRILMEVGLGRHLIHQELSKTGEINNISKYEATHIEANKGSREAIDSWDEYIQVMENEWGRELTFALRELNEWLFNPNDKLNPSALLGSLSSCRDLMKGFLGSLNGEEIGKENASIGALSKILVALKAGLESTKEKWWGIEKWVQPGIIDQISTHLREMESVIELMNANQQVDEWFDAIILESTTEDSANADEKAKDGLSAVE